MLGSVARRERQGGSGQRGPVAGERAKIILLARAAGRQQRTRHDQREREKYGVAYWLRLAYPLWNIGYSSRQRNYAWNLPYGDLAMVVNTSELVNTLYFIFAIYYFCLFYHACCRQSRKKNKIL
jgi:hypothetical protein